MGFGKAVIGVGDGKAVGRQKRNVKKDEVRTDARRQTKAPDPILGFPRSIAMRFEAHAQAKGNLLDVLDDEYFFHKYQAPSTTGGSGALASARMLVIEPSSRRVS